MYVPNPIRCRKCLRLGHFADKCLKESICGFCSKPEHKGNQCDTIVPQCVNCKGNHHSLDIKCPRFVQEKCIKTIQFRDKITYNAAKKLYRESDPIAYNKSYAQIARNSRKVVEVGCQTDAYLSQDLNVNDVIPPRTAIASTSTGSISQKPLPVPLSLTPPCPSVSPPPSSLSLPLCPSLSLPPSLTLPLSPNLTTTESKHSQIAKQPEKTSNKNQPLPQRNPSNKHPKKTPSKKIENNKSGEEMEIATI